jgi:hypothetical protein
MRLDLLAAAMGAALPLEPFDTSVVVHRDGAGRWHRHASCGEAEDDGQLELVRLVQLLDGPTCRQCLQHLSVPEQAERYGEVVGQVRDARVHLTRGTRAAAAGLVEDAAVHAVRAHRAMRSSKLTLAGATDLALVRSVLDTEAARALRLVADCWDHATGLRAWAAAHSLDGLTYAGELIGDPRWRARFEYARSQIRTDGITVFEPALLTAVAERDRAPYRRFSNDWLAALSATLDADERVFEIRYRVSGDAEALIRLTSRAVAGDDHPGLAGALVVAPAWLGATSLESLVGVADRGSAHGSGEDELRAALRIRGRQSTSDALDAARRATRRWAAEPWCISAR